MSDKDILREIDFDCGPGFHLITWDTHRRPTAPRSICETYIGYELRTGDEVLFTGEDFLCSPLHAIDSDKSMACLMGFLTLRPGDTDEEYFKDYTQAQLDYCQEYAEALSCEVMSTLGEE